LSSPGCIADVAFRGFPSPDRSPLRLLADEECQEMDENAKRNKNVRERGVSCFNEALPILQYICSKLDEAQK
jgi:hypothetical protein